MLYFYRNQRDFHPSVAPAPCFFSQSPHSLGILQHQLKSQESTFTPLMPQAAISHIVRCKPVSPRTRTFITIIIIFFNLSSCDAVSLLCFSIYLNTVTFLVRMSRFLQIKPGGGFRREGEERGGRIRNGERSIKKVRFLGRRREDATTTCSFLWAAQAVSVCDEQSHFLVLVPGRLA